MDDATRVRSTPPAIITADHGDLEDTLNRAFHMTSIVVTLLEKAFNVYDHYGDVAYHEKRRQEAPGPYGSYVIHEQDEATLLWAVYEAHAQVREARDLFTGAPDDAPAETVAEAT
jgi:hypothetical protein